MVSINVDIEFLGELVKQRLKDFWDYDDQDLEMYFIDHEFSEGNEGMFEGGDFDLCQYADNIFINDLNNYELGDRDVLIIEKFLADQGYEQDYNDRVYLGWLDISTEDLDLELGKTSFLCAYDYKTKELICSGY